MGSGLTSSYIPILLMTVLLLGCNTINPNPQETQQITVNLPPTPNIAATRETIFQPTGVSTEFSPQFMVAFISSESQFESLPETDLYIINGNGSEVKNLTDIHSISPRFPTWSPDGSRITFLECAGGGFDPGNMLYVITRDGTNLTSMEPILSAKGVTPYCSFESSSVSWSPDGQRFAFRGATTNEP